MDSTEADIVLCGEKEKESYDENWMTWRELLHMLLPTNWWKRPSGNKEEELNHVSSISLSSSTGSLSRSLSRSSSCSRKLASSFRAISLSQSTE